MVVPFPRTRTTPPPTPHIPLPHHIGFTHTHIVLQFPTVWLVGCRLVWLFSSHRVTPVAPGPVGLLTDDGYRWWWAVVVGSHIYLTPRLVPTNTVILIYSYVPHTHTHTHCILLHTQFPAYITTSSYSYHGSSITVYYLTHTHCGLGGSIRYHLFPYHLYIHCGSTPCWFLFYFAVWLPGCLTGSVGLMVVPFYLLHIVPGHIDSGPPHCPHYSSTYRTHYPTITWTLRLLLVVPYCRLRLPVRFTGL